MERLAVALVLIGTLVASSGWVKLPVAAAGCALILLAYRERFAPILARFLLLWLAFSCAVGAGRYWAGTPWLTLLADTCGSLGLALGVCSAVLLVVTGPPGELLLGFDRLHAPREMSYALLSVIGILPRVAAVGSRQMALLKLKDLAGSMRGFSGWALRLRAYPRIVAPLFGVLLSQQLAHARSLGARGFFAAPRIPSTGALISWRGWVVMALLAVDAILWMEVAAWSR